MIARPPSPYDGADRPSPPSHLLRHIPTVKVELSVRTDAGYCDPVVLASADQTVPDELDIDRVAVAVSSAIARAVRLPWHVRILRGLRRRRR